MTTVTGFQALASPCPDSLFTKRIVLEEEGREMQLVEQHIIEKDDAHWARLDTGAFASKNLWNAANYLVRQSFIHHGIYLDNVKVFHQVKSHEAYRALPPNAI